MALEELDIDHRVFEQSREQAQADSSLAIRFYYDALPNDEKSTAEGRPIFDDVEMVEIRVRGDRNNIVQRPARPDDKKRWREAYRAFKDNEEQAVTGTPLAQWGMLSKSLVEELKYLGFVTVEQLAEASDSVCQKMAGLQSFKQKAKVFIEMAKGNNAPLAKLTKDLEEAQNVNATLQRQVAELNAKLATLIDMQGKMQGKKEA